MVEQQYGDDEELFHGYIASAGEPGEKARRILELHQLEAANLHNRELRLLNRLLVFLTAVLAVSGAVSGIKDTLEIRRLSRLADPNVTVLNQPSIGGNQDARASDQTVPKDVGTTDASDLDVSSQSKQQPVVSVSGDHRDAAGASNK